MSSRTQLSRPLTLADRLDANAPLRDAGLLALRLLLGALFVYHGSQKLFG